MHAHRTQRVSEALREELIEIIHYELADPRLASVTVSEVRVSPDLRTAQILILCEDASQEPDALQALGGARRYIRRELAGRLRLWRVPELGFEVDRNSEATRRVEELLQRIKKSRQSS